MKRLLFLLLFCYSFLTYSAGQGFIIPAPINNDNERDSMVDVDLENNGDYKKQDQQGSLEQSLLGGKKKHVSWIAFFSCGCLGKK